jgi:hypothetical protein
MTSVLASSPTRSEPADRRRAIRRAPAGDEPVSRMRLRAGRELTVVDLSDCGALIEGSMRLLPGTHVDVHVVTRDGRALVRSRVVRAYVCHVQADGVRYRGAVAFDRAIDTSAAGYAVPDILAAAPASEGIAYPQPVVASAVASDERLSA